MTLTKNEMIKSLADEFHGAKVTKEVVRQMFDEVQNRTAEAVKNGDEVSFFGFGTFKRTLHHARTARNPQTGEPINVPAKYAINFKASTTLKKQIETNKPKED